MIKQVENMEYDVCVKFVYQKNFNDLTLICLYLIIIYYLNVMDLSVNICCVG